ncbi:malectin domain-containing carbohydrate-binding protein, partial [Winogradskyella sp. A2]|uniref:malectin domain-containing carbohydrate-binding protein n=1 Tax=Winogradskyella sp. A2 TaxID=3366944 RepID=UPI00398C59C2
MTSIDDQQDQIGTTVSIQVLASGGDINEPLVFSISGQPTGLAIDSSTGEISGTIDALALIGGPNSDGVHSVAVTTSRLGSADVMTNFTWTVTDVPLALFRINAGGPELTYNSEVFSADANFVGGKTFENTSATVSPLFQTERSANPPTFEYAFSVPNGDYEVVLHFAEIFFGATGGGSGGVGDRVFDVEGEGITLLDDYDIYADVGPQTEVSKTFMVSVSDGELNLLFDAEGADGVDEPKVSAIEVYSLVQYPAISVDAIADQDNLVDDVISTLGVSASGGNPAANFTYAISG